MIINEIITSIDNVNYDLVVYIKDPISINVEA